MVRAELFEPAPISQGRVFASAAVASADGVVELRWTYVELAREAGMFTGVRVYRLRDGDEMRQRDDSLELVKDVGVKDSVNISGLRNGARYIFVVCAYDEFNKDVEQVLLFGFPGSRPKKVPPAVGHPYAAAGSNAISVFWDRLEEANIAGYEILRRRADEKDFSELGRVEKVTFIHGSRTGAALSWALPELEPTMYRDGTALPGIAYVYQVRAVDDEGRRGPGAETLPVGLAEDRSPVAEEVLILATWHSADSQKVARHYAARRGIPMDNILVVTPHEGNKFRNRQVIDEVREHLLEKGLAGKIRVIAPTFGVPLGDGLRALDSMLSDVFDRYSRGRIMGAPNPLFLKDMHHDPSLGLYLVSRLDGPTPEIAMALVDKAIEAEKTVTPRSGNAFFTSTAFGKEGMVAAERHGVRATLEDRKYTLTNSLPDNIMWMFADGHDYKAIRMSPWPLGSVGGYLKSNTLIRMRDNKYKYWVPGLLEEGITATFGATIEPYLQGYTRGCILLDRFWTGKYTFSESFFMSTPTLNWAMCAVGDPLYKIKKQ